MEARLGFVSYDTAESGRLCPVTSFQGIFGPKQSRTFAVCMPLRLGLATTGNVLVLGTLPLKYKFGS